MLFIEDGRKKGAELGEGGRKLEGPKIKGSKVSSFEFPTERWLF